MRLFRAMNSILGRAPIVDFDGTLARLDVPWDDVRQALGSGESANCGTTTHQANGLSSARRRRQRLAQPTSYLRWSELWRKPPRLPCSVPTARPRCGGFSIALTICESRADRVVGRETLAGPKTDFDVFARGFSACIEATAAVRDGAVVVYVGDMSYELAFARRLGARSIHVEDL